MEDSSWEKSWNQVDFLLPCFVSHILLYSINIDQTSICHFLVKSKFLRRPPSKLPRCQQQRQLGFWLWELCVDCLPNPKTGTGKRKPWNPGICGWVTKLSYCTNLKLTRAQFVRSWNPWCDFPFWRIWNQQFEPPNIGMRHVTGEETWFCFPSYKWENLRNQGLWVSNRNGHRQVFALHFLSSFVLEHLTSASQEWRFISKKTLDLTKKHVCGSNMISPSNNGSQSQRNITVKASFYHHSTIIKPSFFTIKPPLLGKSPAFPTQRDARRWMRWMPMPSWPVLGPSSLPGEATPRNPWFIVGKTWGDTLW